MSKPNIPIKFHIYQGDSLVRTEELAQDIIKVGKLASSHLRIDDDNVSRMHAVIEVTGPDSVSIIDLGSASGTIVNGKKVNKAKIHTGDEVLFGDTKVVIEVGRPLEAGAAPPAPPPAGQRAATPPAAPQPPAAAPPARPQPPAAPAAAAPAARQGAAAPTPKANPFASSGGGLPNPFAAPLPGMGGSDDEEDGEHVQYGIVASGPPVSPDEVETKERAVEVVIMWGDRSVLHVEHLSPPRAFYVGEPAEDKKAGKGQSVDYLIGSEVLGTSRMPIVLESGGATAVVIPAGATGEVVQGEDHTTFEQLAATGQLHPSSEMPGAQQYMLPPGATAKVRFKDFVFVVKPVNAGKVVSNHMDVEWRPLFYIGGSAAVFAIFLLLFYFLPPSPASLSLDMLNTDNRLVKYLMEPPATQQEETPKWLQSNKADKAGGKGKRHKGEEGQMGKQDAKKTNNRYAIQGPADNQNPQMARAQAKEMAANAGILGTLKAMQGAWNSPTSPYGADTAIGNDPMSALGALMGDQIGSNFGFGGLGLRGTGRGGGGTGEGTIGLGNLGTIGHGGGGGSGSGYGRGAGSFHGRHSAVPQIRQGTAAVRGSLSKEVIRRVIERHINEVRFCYEQQLNQRPDLQGRVTVKFIISPTGAVQSAVVGETSLGSPPAENCIAQAVRRWTFPAPEGGGIVIVNYPFMLTASGG